MLLSSLSQNFYFYTAQWVCCVHHVLNLVNCFWCWLSKRFMSLGPLFQIISKYVLVAAGLCLWVIIGNVKTNLLTFFCCPCFFFYQFFNNSLLTLHKWELYQHFFHLFKTYCLVPAKAMEAFC